MGVNPLARQIFRTLKYDKSIEWNVSTLSERFGHSRTKIREITSRNVSGGYMYRSYRKIGISDKGLQVLQWANDETCEIAMGLQVGFTEELIRHYREVGSLGVDAEASTISFPNDINLF